VGAGVVRVEPIRPADDLIRLPLGLETWQWEKSDERRRCRVLGDKQDAAAGLEEPTSAAQHFQVPSVPASGTNAARRHRDARMQEQSSTAPPSVFLAWARADSPCPRRTPSRPSMTYCVGNDHRKYYFLFSREKERERGKRGELHDFLPLIDRQAQAMAQIPRRRPRFYRSVRPAKTLRCLEHGHGAGNHFQNRNCHCNCD